MKEGGKGAHAFGEADWWGEDLFGIDNALVGNWPVVVIQDGKARIKGFKSIPDWYAKHGDLLEEAYGSLRPDVEPALVECRPHGLGPSSLGLTVCAQAFGDAIGNRVAGVRPGRCLRHPLSG